MVETCCLLNGLSEIRLLALVTVFRQFELKAYDSLSKDCGFRMRYHLVKECSHGDSNYQRCGPEDGTAIY